MKKRKALFSEKGVTLVELLIASSIAVIIGALLLAVLINSAGIFYKQTSRVNQGLNSNDALNLVRQSIKESNGAAASYQVDSKTYISSSNELILKIPSIDAQGNVISETYDYFVFYKDQDKLFLKSFPDTQSSRKAQNQILASNVVSVFFQYLNNVSPPQEVIPTSAVKIKLTLMLRQKIGSQLETSIATSEASLRNN